MTTNIQINDELMGEALKLSGQRTKKAVVNMALEEFVQRRRQHGILKHFGTVDFDPRYDHKTGRRR